MQQQPLAFTLVKTVVSARDEGKVLSPALATAWDLLRTELSPAHRVIASEVSWAPSHQEDLKFVIEGVRRQFEKDPDLEEEFLAFLAEVEPYGKGDNDATIFPILGGITAGSDIPPTIGEIAFDIETNELDVEQTPSPADSRQPDELLEPEVLDTPPVVEQQPVELDTAEAITESLQFEDIEPSLEEIDAPLEEVSDATEALESEPPPSLTERPNLEAVNLSDNPTTLESSTALLRYWPFAAGILLVALLAFGAWIVTDSTSTKSIAERVNSEQITSDTIVEQTEENNITTESSLEYSAPNTAKLSLAVDSLRKSGDYTTALATQRELAQILEEQHSPNEETAQAFSELAILYAAQDDALQAVVEQRKSLSFARQAFAKTDPALGRSHLKLASFYTDSGELHMARAHLQQARKIFGQAQELVTPTDIEKSEQVAERILNAS